MRCSKIESEREVYSKTGLHQEIRKISQRRFNFTPKGDRKEVQKKPKFSRMKETIKIKA